LRVASGFNFARNLVINDIDIGVADPDDPAAPYFSSAEDLAAKINAAATGVSAHFGVGGVLVLSNATGHDIVIGPADYAGVTDNALGVTAGLYGGTFKIDSDEAIRLKLTGGSPADLSRLGFATGAYIDGQVPEDLVVFVTGTGSGKVAAGYEVGALDPVAALRAREFQVEFTATDRFVIRDVATNTVVAERNYTPGENIRYGGLVLAFDGPPAKGDRFLIDGNGDGRGDNANILAIAGLEKARDMIAGNRTFAEAYRERVTAVGNAAGQARISRTALEVVNQQAVQARDRVSGVNLDREAADLIRFQQAYQASAKVIQVAGQLFDAIIQLR
jgi:hypothetical protein